MIVRASPLSLILVVPYLQEWGMYYYWHDDSFSVSGQELCDKFSTHVTSHFSDKCTRIAFSQILSKEEKKHKSKGG